MKQVLKKGAVPSKFSWTKEESMGMKSRRMRAERRRHKSLASDVCLEPEIENVACNLSVCDEVCGHQDDVVSVHHFVPAARSTNNKSTQTVGRLSSFSISNFVFDARAVHYYTGLENYDKFAFVLATLGPAAYCLRYRWRQCHNISVEDQFFLTMIKLRLHTPDFELSRMFDVSEFSVGNIFVTWINFMSLQWHEIDIWPSRDLVSYFMPTDFWKKFPSTRIIIDGMECPIKKPAGPVAQQASFSTYKNRNTVKVVVGSTPGGLLSHIPQSFGGSASDRQLIERSNLVDKCDPHDSVMADKGFNVQDIFAMKDISVNIPTFMTGKNRLPGLSVLRDRKIASKRVHIERIIGLAKTYKILQQPMNVTESALASEIIFVCCMMCNFRNCIIPTTA